MLTFTTFIQSSIASSSHINQARKKKASKLEERVKLSLFADDLILYIENAENCQKMLELINKISTVAG